MGGRPGVTHIENVGIGVGDTVKTGPGVPALGVGRVAVPVTAADGLAAGVLAGTGVLRTAGSIAGLEVGGGGLAW